MMFKSIIATAAAMICMSAMNAHAHVGLKTPCGRYQPAAGCPAPPAGQSIDYDVNSPIGTHDSISSPICKHTVPYSVRTQFSAGATINTEYSVGASHGGGHCQWALSYDDGATWVVLKTMIRECLKGAQNGQAYTVPVQIPADAPPGKATFMWLWNNAIGNRELYSNCADIEITGGTAGGSIKGVAPLIANYGSSSVLIPEFPNPGDNDMASAFDSRPSITVFASGSGSIASVPKLKSQLNTTGKPKPKPNTTGNTQTTATDNTQTTATDNTQTTATDNTQTTATGNTQTTATGKPQPTTTGKPKPTKTKKHKSHKCKSKKTNKHKSHKCKCTNTNQHKSHKCKPTKTNTPMSSSPIPTTKTNKPKSSNPTPTTTL